jgi:hypothetical protein
MTYDERPIILEARCDECSRFVHVLEVWQGSQLAVTRVVAECRTHGRRELPAHCYLVWWPGE